MDGTDEALARLAAFAGEGEIAWPDGEGVSVRPGVMGGDPCFTGTRIWLWLLVNSVWDDATILQQYPSLTPEALAHGHAYVAEHEALFRAALYRHTMREGELADVMLLQADVRALLAALETATGRVAWLEAMCVYWRRDCGAARREGRRRGAC